MPACWFETSLQNFEANISAAQTWNILDFSFNFSNSMIGEDFFFFEKHNKESEKTIHGSLKIKRCLQWNMIITIFDKGITQCNE